MYIFVKLRNPTIQNDKVIKSKITHKKRTNSKKEKKCRKIVKTGEFERKLFVCWYNKDRKKTYTNVLLVLKRNHICTHTII